MFFANLDWSLALVSMLVVYHGNSKKRCAKSSEAPPGTPERWVTPKAVGENIGDYPLVMTNIAIKKDAHRNRWFPY